MKYWSVRKCLCPECGEGQWVVFSNGAVFGCRDTFSEAIEYATRKARTFESTLGLVAS